MNVRTMKTGKSLATTVTLAVIAVFLCRPEMVAEEKIPPSAEPICGFKGRYFFYQAAQVQRGLSVELFVGDARVNQPVTLRFHVTEKPRGFPIDDLQIEHQKLIHILGVRTDLNEFFHVHPVKVEPGLWAATHVFTNGGNYQIWSDVKYRGTSYIFAHPVLTVAGPIRDAATNVVSAGRVRKDGYQIALKHSEPLVAGGTNQLQFRIEDLRGNPVRTENFLGAPMHLILVKEDLSVYLHAHSDNHTTIVDPTIYFTQTFPQPGRYKLFAQFRPNKTKLPPEESILAEFQVDVVKP